MIGELLAPVLKVIAYGGWAAALAVWLATHPDKAGLIWAWLTRRIAWASKRAERSTVSAEAEALVRGFAEQTNKQAGQVLPSKLKIEWQIDTTREAFFSQQGQVIVRLDHHRNQDRNIALATTLFVVGHALPHTRPHLDGPLAAALDLTLVKKALAGLRRAGPLTWCRSAHWTDPHPGGIGVGT